MLHKNELKLLLAIHCSYWPHAKIDELTEKVWLEEFREYSIFDLFKAIKLLARSEKFAPSIASIHNALNSIENGPISKDSAAWELRHSSKEKLIVEAYRRWGGLRRERGMSDTNPEWNPDYRKAQTELAFAKKEFQKIYNDLVETASEQKNLDSVKSIPVSNLINNTVKKVGI